MVITAYLIGVVVFFLYITYTFAVDPADRKMLLSRLFIPIVVLLAGIALFWPLWILIIGTSLIREKL